MTNLVLWVAVCFAWRPAADESTNVIGYRLWVGSQSGVYDRSVFVKKPATNTCTMVIRGTTNYFTLTAVDNNDNDSLPAKELSVWTDKPAVVVKIEGSNDGTKWTNAHEVIWEPTISTNQMRLYRGVMEFR